MNEAGWGWRKPKRVSWVDWDTWELECICGRVNKMSPEPKKMVRCPCGITWKKVRG